MRDVKLYWIIFLGEPEVKNVDKADLEAYLTRKIGELKEEISYLEALLAMLRGEGKENEGELLPSEVKVITSNGNVLANVVEGDGVAKIIFTEGFPKDSSYVKSFLLKMLEDKKASGVINSYEVNERKGFITEIVIWGELKESLLRELELAIQFVWKNMGSGKSSA